MKTRKVLFLLLLLLLSTPSLAAQSISSDSIIKIKIENGKYVVSGAVADETTKSEALEKIANQAGNEIDSAQLKINPAITPFAFGWQKNFEKSLLRLKNWKTGVFIFNNNSGAVTYQNLPDEILNARLLLAAENQTVSIADLQNKTLVLFFFASWSGPCRKFSDELQTFYPEFSSNGVEILGVNADADADADFIKLVEAKKFSYKTALGNKKLLDAAIEISKFSGIPQAFVIRNGSLHGIFTGSSPQVFKRLRETVLEISKTK